MLSQARIRELFVELDAELCAVGVRGDVFVVGGAALAVAYDARPSTRDMDRDLAAFPGGSGPPAARIADRHDDIDDDWLNDGAKGFMPGDDRGRGPVIHDGECLTVSAGSPRVPPGDEAAVEPGEPR